MSVMDYGLASVAEGEGEWIARDGTRVVVRPIGPDDAAREQAFVQALSPRSRQQRFMHAIRELSPVQLARFTRPDPACEFALAALLRAADGVETQLAVARFVTGDDAGSCEFAIVVADAWQQRGLGHELMARLIEEATRRGLRRMVGRVLADNQGMLALARALGFSVAPAPDEPGVRQVILMLGLPPV